MKILLKTLLLLLSIKYNPKAWCVDIQFQSKGTFPVVLEFSFEASKPVVREDPERLD